MVVSWKYRDTADGQRIASNPGQARTRDGVRSASSASTSSYQVGVGRSAGRCWYQGLNASWEA